MIQPERPSGDPRGDLLALYDEALPQVYGYLLDGGADPSTDDWDARLDAARAHDTLARLAPQHRAALTLRHLDDLPVAEVAELLHRTVGATEVLLVRARRAFRVEYERTGGQDR